MKRRNEHCRQQLVHCAQVRPLLEQEKQKGGAPCVEVPESCVVQLPSKRGGSEGYRFDFDRVYKMNSPGRQMFAEVVQPLLGRFLQGFNTTVCPSSNPPRGTHPMQGVSCNVQTSMPCRDHHAKQKAEPAEMRGSSRNQRQVMMGRVWVGRCLRMGRRGRGRRTRWARQRLSGR